MPNLRSASWVGRDEGGHSCATQTVGRRGTASVDVGEGRRQAAKSGRWHSGATKRQGAEQVDTVHGTRPMQGEDALAQTGAWAGVTRGLSHVRDQSRV